MLFVSESKNMKIKCKKMKGEKEQENKLLSDEKGSRGIREEKNKEKFLAKLKSHRKTELIFLFGLLRIQKPLIGRS